MVGQKREKLLTPTETLRLINRKETEDKKVRAANDIRMKKKLSAWLKNVPDALLIIENLPEDYIRETVSDNDLFKLLKLVETGMHILDFSPVGGRIWEDRWIGSRPGGATDLDISRSVDIYRHIQKMYDFIGHGNPVIDFCNLDPLDRDPDFHDKVTAEERRGLDRIRQIIATKKAEEPPK
jgi:hypothetical protein